MKNRIKTQALYVPPYKIVQLPQEDLEHRTYAGKLTSFHFDTGYCMTPSAAASDIVSAWVFDATCGKNIKIRDGKIRF